MIGTLEVLDRQVDIPKELEECRDNNDRFIQYLINNEYPDEYVRFMRMYALYEEKTIVYPMLIDRSNTYLELMQFIECNLKLAETVALIRQFYILTWEAGADSTTESEK